MSKLLSSELRCPSCQYDLRGCELPGENEIRCPECGCVWDLLAIRRIEYPQDHWSRATWIVTTYGAAVVCPAIYFGLRRAIESDFAAAVIPLSMLGIYSVWHSAATTPKSRRGWSTVLLRAIVHFVMNLMLAVVAWMMMVLGLSFLGLTR